MRFEIVKYGHPVLRQKGRPIDKVTDKIRRFARDMLSTMYDVRGLGLAAQQVGQPELICVIDVPPEAEGASGQIVNPGVKMPLVMVNPTILGSVGGVVRDEGCLSFPEFFASIRRAEEVTVLYTDLDREERTLRAVGLLARAIQHELDHLNGVLLVDRMSPLHKLAAAARLRRIKKENRPRR